MHCTKMPFWYQNDELQLVPAGANWIVQTTPVLASHNFIRAQLSNICTSDYFWL